MIRLYRRNPGEPAEIGPQTPVSTALASSPVLATLLGFRQENRRVRHH